MIDSEQIKVLLVEDDEDDYILTRGLFSEMRGNRVKLDWCKSYSLGLEAMARNQHDLCLVDYRLGKHNGVELLKEALAGGCQAPVILLTGLGEHAVDVEAMNAGAADYLVKTGLRSDSLERSIRYAVERKRAAAKAAFEQANLAAFGAEVGLALTRREALGGILHSCADAMVRYLNVHLAQVWILDLNDNQLHLKASAGAINDVESAANPIVKLAPDQYLPADLQPVLLNDFRAKAMVPCRAWVEREGIVAYAGYPLRLENRLMGLISIYSHTPLSQAVIQQMASVANGMALSIENKRAEEALDASEVRYRSVLERLKEIVFRVDEFGHWTALNPAWTEITGFEVKESLGTLFLEFIHHDDRQRNSHIFLQLVERKLDFCRYETRLLTKDGKVRWVEMYAQLAVNKDGGVLGASGSITDITERKHAEKQIQKLAAFPRVNPNPVLEFDAGGTITYFNDAAQALATHLGRAQPQDILPANAGEIARQVLASGQKRLNDDVAINNKTISWSFFPISQSQVVHCYGVDVTDMQNLEAQFRHAQKLESVGQLAAGVAHDFNNILTVIQGYADYLKAQYDGDAALTGPLKQISDASRRAATLTRQLLMFSRKQVLQPKILDLNLVIQNLSNMLGRVLGEDIVLETTYGVLPTVEADAGMLEQILMNLAVNARDAMPQGGKISIVTSARDIAEEYARHRPDARAGRTVCFSFSDTGCGMDRETLNRIFEPFFSTKEVGKGTGLGLATVHGIVKQHRGWIEVESEPGRGTSFGIFLPAAGRSVETVEKTNPIREQTRPATNQTILIAEDEPMLRQLLKEMLEQSGYRVLEAGTGVEALKVWDEHEGEIGLLLTDMVMPEGMTGRDLARQLKTRSANLPVIITSGYSAEIMGEDADLRGVNFLPKPYDAPQLIKLVGDCLEGARSQAELACT
jgi:two-component system cell cycle sensor histidine kinase/response regulator CckA